MEKGPTDVKLKDLWVNANAQETVVISKDMYREFFFSHYQRLARELKFYPADNRTGTGRSILKPLAQYAGQGV